MVCSVFQRYNLKAIHNSRCWDTAFNGGVLSISKIQSESNSQLNMVLPLLGAGCAQYFKDTI